MNQLLDLLLLHTFIIIKLHQMAHILLHLRLQTYLAFNYILPLEASFPYLLPLKDIQIIPLDHPFLPSSCQFRISQAFIPFLNSFMGLILLQYCFNQHQSQIACLLLFYLIIQLDLILFIIIVIVVIIIREELVTKFIITLVEVMAVTKRIEQAK